MAKFDYHNFYMSQYNLLIIFMQKCFGYNNSYKKLIKNLIIIQIQSYLNLIMLNMIH